TGILGVNLAISTGFWRIPVGFAARLSRHGAGPAPTRCSCTPKTGAPPAAPCRPRSHVVFLKTHKTGGSSVLNLLSRYGESRRLRFALPRRYQFGYPAPFRAERVRGFSAGGRKFDIICHHMRFNLSEVRLGAKQGIWAGDAQRLVLLLHRAATGPVAKSGLLIISAAAARGNHYARNLQWFDFGLPEAAEPARVPALLGELERVFPLVLLAERFDESLVLLRHRLCWPRDAVDLFPLTAAPAPGCPRGSWAPLAPGTSLDWALSTHFNRSFWRGSAPGWSGCGAERPSCGGAAQRPGALCLQGGAPCPPGAIARRALRPFPPPGAARHPGLQRCARGCGRPSASAAGAWRCPSCPTRTCSSRSSSAPPTAPLRENPGFSGIFPKKSPRNSLEIGRFGAGTTPGPRFPIG
uniref:Uncharacterized protein n=1 Tax=Geospiza parvula TaxID=87175 RepID=A0A8U8BL36_GEOPR